jgi:hypothetical protein
MSLVGGHIEPYDAVWNLTNYLQLMLRLPGCGKALKGSLMFRNMRGQRVAQMLHALTLEGITVDDSDISILFGYLKGNVSGHDLLAHACQFTTLSAYQDWLCMTLKTSGRKSTSSPSVEQIVGEVEAFIRRKHLERSDNVAPQLYVPEAAIGYQRDIR